MYYRNAQAALVVYDITKSSSLLKAKHWVAELQRQASPGIVIALVGNKLDLTNDVIKDSTTSAGEGEQGATGESASGESEGGGGGDGGGGAAAEEQEEETTDARKISTSEAKTYADEENLLFFETSAKLGTNVTDVFTAIANAIPESNLKTSRGAGGAGAGQGGLGARRPGEDSRVNLGERTNTASNDGCAC